ncbi:MAG: hypothetical protein WCT14_18375 [Treponemataceae bacterium]
MLCPLYRKPEALPFPRETLKLGLQTFHRSEVFPDALADGARVVIK